MEEIITKREIIDPYGFIYITTNLINGKRYLGQRRFTKGWQKYLGSGKVFKDALKKYGKENFHRNIIYICYSEEELNKAEYQISVFLDVVESDDWYNLVYGGGSTRGWKHSIISKEKMKKAKEGKYNGENNPNFGNHKLSGENAPWYGKHLTEEARQKMSKARKGKKLSEEHKKKIGDAGRGEKHHNYGKHIFIGITNPRQRYRYSPELDEYFWGAKEVEDKYGIHQGSIGKCCSGNQKHAGRHPVTGVLLTWRYATKEEYDNYIKQFKEKENE